MFEKSSLFIMMYQLHKRILEYFGCICKYELKNEQEYQLYIVLKKCIQVGRNYFERLFKYIFVC